MPLGPLRCCTARSIWRWPKRCSSRWAPQCRTRKSYASEERSGRPHRRPAAGSPSGSVCAYAGHTAVRHSDGEIAHTLGVTIQLIYVLLIFSEIFTTFIADLYGITLQLHQRTGMPKKVISALIMMVCYAISQFGFRNLLSFLYPLFGMFSLIWLYLLLRAAQPAKPGPPPPIAPSPAAGRSS